MFVFGCGVHIHILLYIYLYRSSKLGEKIIIIKLNFEGNRNSILNIYYPQEFVLLTKYFLNPSVSAGVAILIRLS